MEENEVTVDVEESVKKFCEEFSNSMLRTEAERDFRKDAIQNISEKLNISKKTLAFCGKTYHKQDFNTKAIEQAEMSQFFAKVFGIDLEESEEFNDSDVD